MLLAVAVGVQSEMQLALHFEHQTLLPEVIAHKEE